MSKRRINKQQSLRIQKIQHAYHQEKESKQDMLFDGLVRTRQGKAVLVETASGKIISCSIRPNLEVPVAGDRVIWQTEHREGGVVLSLYPRTSLLARESSTGLLKAVAANLSQLIIVIAAKPLCSFSLLDSYLVIAERLQIKALILLNKTDLPCATLKRELQEIYEPLGYPTLYCSIADKESVAQMEKKLKDEVSVFVGQSGVGKSSLIQSILPHEQQIRTQEISKEAELGKHTTSNSHFYHLQGGGALIDSPGVRSFTLSKLSPQELLLGYREFKPDLNACKYRNCSHIQTPGCAILDAVSRGTIAARRYENFLKLGARVC